MSVQYTPYAVPFVVAGVAMLGLIVYAVLRGRREGFDKTSLAFVAITGCAAIWIITRFFQIISVEYELKLFWVTLLYVGYGFIGPSLLCFALAYTGREELVDWRLVGALSVIPLGAIILAATNVSHQLLWTDELLVHGGAVVLEREFNTLFVVYALYNVTLIVTGAVLLVRWANRTSGIYRRQMYLFVTGIAIPTIVGLAWALELVPGVPHFLDPTAFGFALMCVFLAVALYRYRLLDLAPVARDAVIENMRDGYVVIDEQGRVVDLNPSAETILGERSVVVGEPLRERLPAVAELLDAEAVDERAETEIQAETIDGERRFFVAHLSGLEGADQSGRLLTLRDVTDRRAVQRRYQVMIENASDVYSILDRDGRITYASPSIEGVLGYAPEAVEGRPAVELIHPDDRADVLEFYEDLLTEPGLERRAEYRVRHRDGGWRVVESVAQNLLEEHFIEGIVVSSRDVTERKRRERELEESNERLEQFASVVSHDLRNPLNVADAYVEQILYTGDPELASEIRVSLDRMQTIIDDVLSLARQGQELGEIESLDVTDVATAAWEHVETPDADLEIEESLRVNGDRDRLSQLFENLFRNAVTHGRPDEEGEKAPGDDTLTVAVGTLDGGEGFYVADDGVGIDPDERDRVLEQGYTNSADGTGFGLAIVEEIANAHDWSVAVEESADGGARFEFEFEGTTDWDGSG